jgi:hypothetical protein
VQLARGLAQPRCDQHRDHLRPRHLLLGGGQQALAQIFKSRPAPQCERQNTHRQTAVAAPPGSPKSAPVPSDQRDRPQTVVLVRVNRSDAGRALGLEDVPPHRVLRVVPRWVESCAGQCERSRRIASSDASCRPSCEWSLANTSSAITRAAIRRQTYFCHRRENSPRGCFYAALSTRHDPRSTREFDFLMGARFSVSPCARGHAFNTRDQKMLEAAAAFLSPLVGAAREAEAASAMFRGAPRLS